MRNPKFVPHALSWTLAVLAVIALGAAASVGPEASLTSVGQGSAGDSIKVSIVFQGLGGSMGFDSPDACPGANRQGTDAMTGTLAWIEFDAEDLSVRYEGVLSRATGYLLCEAKQTLKGDEWCTIKLTGSSRMDVSVEVDGDGRGAYVKAEAVKGWPVQKSAAGDCDGEMVAETRNAYPDDDVMSGIAFETVPSGPLAVGGEWKSGKYALKVIQ